MRQYSFLPEAETEYLEAVRFYEEQRAGLGNNLIFEFESWFFNPLLGFAAALPMARPLASR